MRSNLVISVTSILVSVLAGCSTDNSGSGAAGPSGEAGATGTSSEIFDDEATPVATNSTETTPIASERVATLLDGLADSVGAMQGDGGTGLVMESTDSALSNGCSSSTSEGSGESLDLSGLEELLRDARGFAQDHVFRSEFVESDDGTTVTYLIDPVSACDGDTECLTKLGENPLRFAVNMLDDDSLSVRMLVGAERHNPASMRMSATALGLTADLSELMDSVKLFMDAEDRDDLPQTFAGVVDLSLVKNAERDFTFSLSLLEDLRLEVESEPGKAVSVNVAASQPTSQLRLDANTNTMSWRQNLATVDVAAAGAFFCDDDSDCGDQERQGTFRLHLAGVTGQLEMSPNSDEFNVTGYGLGSETSYVALNDSRLVSVDLNPDSGRTLNIQFKDTPQGILVSFEPQLDLTVATALTHLSDSLKVDLPEWLFDEVFDVTLGGDPKPSILIRRPQCDEFGEPTGDSQVEVESGTLTLSATSSQPVTVTAGMCVVPVEGNNEEPHPFEMIAAAVCE